MSLGRKLSDASLDLPAGSPFMFRPGKIEGPTASREKVMAEAIALNSDCPDPVVQKEFFEKVEEVCSLRGKLPTVPPGIETYNDYNRGSGLVQLLKTLGKGTETKSKGWTSSLLACVDAYSDQGDAPMRVLSEMIDYLEPCEEEMDEIIRLELGAKPEQVAAFRTAVSAALKIGETLSRKPLLYRLSFASLIFPDGTLNDSQIECETMVAFTENNNPEDIRFVKECMDLTAPSFESDMNAFLETVSADREFLQQNVEFLKEALGRMREERSTTVTDSQPDPSIPIAPTAGSAVTDTFSDDTHSTLGSEIVPLTIDTAFEPSVRLVHDVLLRRLEGTDN